MERPSVNAVFMESWGGARAALRLRPKFYLWWYVAAAVIGALSLLAPASLTQPTKPGEPWIAAPMIFGIVAWALMVNVFVYFVVADTVRTFVPEFKMTLSIFSVQFIINMAYSAIIQFAMYFFVVPAFWLGPKLWLWLPKYLLTANDEHHDIVGALQRSWNDTTGIYWETFGLMALTGLILAIVVLLGILIACLLVQLFNPLGIVTLPLLTWLFGYFVAEIYHANLGWAVAARRYAASLPVPVPAAT